MWKRSSHSIPNVVPHSPDIVLRFAQLAGDDLPRETGSLIGFEGAKDLLVLVSPDGRELGEGTGDKEALRRRFPGAFGVALASHFFDGSCDAVESFGGVGTEAGTGASTRWWGGGRF